MGKIRFVYIRSVWNKSKDLERIKDVYRGTTVFCCLDSFSSYVESPVVKRTRSQYYFGVSRQKETADTTVDLYFIINKR
jgi:hypothetical protein